MKIFVVSILFLLIFVKSAFSDELSKLDSLSKLLSEAPREDSIGFLIEIGELHFGAENYLNSFHYFFSALKLAEATDNQIAIADAANSIGRVYYNLENFKEGLEYFKKAHDFFLETRRERKRGGALNNIALIYYELDSIDLAIDHYKRALEINQSYNDTLNIGTIYHNLGLVYMDQKKYEEAIEYLILSRDIFVELKYEKFAANTTNNIGRLYYRAGKYQEALSYFRKGLEEAKELNSAFLIMDNYKYQADCYEKMYKYRDAYTFSIKHYKLKDSLLNIDKNKEIAEIQAKYENEIEEQENELLKKENEANEATIKMQYVAVIGIFIIAILVSVLAIFYYNGNQTKKKANDLLMSQKLTIEDKNKVLSDLNQEITAQNEEIKEQKRELEELNEIKDKLFSIISHEFRSPLNSLKGTLALLKVGALSEDELNLISKELTDKINNTSIFLDNLLNWAKSQMRGIRAKPTDVSLNEVANENILLLKSMADKKRIRLENYIKEDRKAYADPNMMKLIFRNLISNAIKFSLRGGTIHIDSQINGLVNTISVKDEGIGLSKENIKMLFKVQSFTTRGTANERGTGLGLYITKNFIESNGGQIWVESEEGSGSTFKFTIPTSKNYMESMR
ncbi:MAG: tetratricopeptide repeat-containing sensor histidine kinase [Cytophagales bacterium]|nr:tetratricopeptide repeat-containing sensor histidine kinase [Cytophagales bacterium]